MISYKATIHKFEEKGEKTGWTYIDLPADLAQELNPNVKTTYRVKGTLDSHPIHQVALIPMGEGNFIIAVNAEMRKGIKKKEGAQISVNLEVDTSEIPLAQDLIECLAEESKALEHFNTLSPGHQRYFSNWVNDAKTIETKTKRISQAVMGLSMGMDFGQMIRYFKNKQQ